MELRCLIIDDEPPARRLLREYLSSHDDVEVVGECVDGLEAIEAVEALKPDLIFLDIQMPELDGFELLSALECRPQVIFSTAFDQYAVRAFEVSAADYLLKPYTQSRLDEALDRVRERIRQSKPMELDRLMDALRPAARPLERILVRETQRLILVQTREIAWAEALEDYVQLHTSRDAHLLSQTLGWLEERLDPERFVRVHRSALVNLGAVAELRPLDNGRMTCVLTSGRELPVSRAGVKRLKAMGGMSLS